MAPFTVKTAIAECAEDARRPNPIDVRQQTIEESLPLRLLGASATSAIAVLRQQRSPD
jgi:hypothetical protein